MNENTSSVSSALLSLQTWTNARPTPTTVTPPRSASTRPAATPAPAPRATGSSPDSVRVGRDAVRQNQFQVSGRQRGRSRGARPGTIYIQVLDRKKSESKERGKRSEAAGAEKIYLSASDLFTPSFDSASDVCCQKASNPPDKMVRKKN